MRLWRGLSILCLTCLLAAWATTDGHGRWLGSVWADADLRVVHEKIDVGRREGRVTVMLYGRGLGWFVSCSTTARTR